MLPLPAPAAAPARPLVRARARAGRRPPPKPDLAAQCNQKACKPPPSWTAAAMQHLHRCPVGLRRHAQPPAHPGRRPWHFRPDLQDAPASSTCIPACSEPRAARGAWPPAVPRGPQPQPARPTRPAAGHPGRQPLGRKRGRRFAPVARAQRQRVRAGPARHRSALASAPPLRAFERCRAGARRTRSPARGTARPSRASLCVL